jgi:hypothetical protein
MPTAAPPVWRPSSARRVALDGFLPVPRGGSAVPTTLVWPAKDPSDVLDFELDIGPALTGNKGDGIATIDATVVPSNAGDLVLNKVAADGSIAVFWFGGGQAGTVYTVQVSIGTINGRTLGRAILLPVLALSAVAPTTVALITDGGAVITDQNGNPILVGG